MNEAQKYLEELERQHQERLAAIHAQYHLEESKEKKNDDL